MMLTHEQIVTLTEELYERWHLWADGQPATVALSAALMLLCGIAGDIHTDPTFDGRPDTRALATRVDDFARLTLQSMGIAIKRVPVAMSSDRTM